MQNKWYNLKLWQQTFGDGDDDDSGDGVNDVELYAVAVNAFGIVVELEAIVVVDGAAIVDGDDGNLESEHVVDFKFSNEEELEHEEDLENSDEEEIEHKTRSFGKSNSYKDKKSKIEKGRSFIDDDEEDRVSSDEEQIEYKSQPLEKYVSKNKVDQNKNKSICSYNADVEDGYKSCLSRKSLSSKQKKITEYISSNFDEETKCKPESPQKSVSRKEIKKNIENIPSSSDESSDSSLNERKDVNSKLDVKKHSLYHKQNEEKIENEAETISPSKRRSLLNKKTKIDVGKNNSSCNMGNLNHSKRKSLSFEESKLKSIEKNKSLRNSLHKRKENVETKESISQTHSDSDFVEIRNMSDNESSTEEENECNLSKNLSYKNVKYLNEQEEADSSDEDKIEINKKSVNKSTKKKYSLNKRNELPTSSSEPEKSEADVADQSQTLNNKHSLNTNSKIQTAILSNSKKRKFRRDLERTSSSDEDEIKLKATAKVSSRLCTSFIDFNKIANEKYYEKLHTSCTVNTFEVGDPEHQTDESGYEKVEEHTTQLIQAVETDNDEFHDAEEHVFTNFEQIDKIHVDNRRRSLAPTGHRIPDQSLNAGQSFIENISEDKKETRKDKNIKRKRMTQSFCSAGSLDTTDFELRHVNKKRKILGQNDSEVDKSLEDLTAKNMKDVLEKNKNEVSQEQDTNPEVPKKAAIDNVNSPVVDSKNDFKRKEKTKLAVEQALKFSADVITQMSKKKKKNKKLVDGNKHASKQDQITEESISEAVSKSEDQAQTSIEVHKIKSSAGDIIETPITPKKKIHITTFNLPTGTVCVEPMTPCRKAIVNGFRESPFTPKCVGFKVESNCQDLSPTSSRKSRKRKRYIEEPKHSLPKPKWTQSGQFIEEEMSTGEIVNLKKGKKVDSLQLSKESALNFKNRALFRKNIQRESSQTLLRRKERGFQNKF
ncbi:slender lobes-like protein [Teleopsis dalmanni]|uniref:slender lobes-like protein n=1 Tax=Teleopsis dalmanni TaxID=139649 RepID=UPI0018CE256F|nr:slender lobes-like protein [Teleopsis dalmanni]